MSEVIHEVIETPFQVAMECQHVPEQADHICWNCTIKIIDLAERAEARAAELEQQLAAEQAAHKSDVEALRTELRLAYDAYHRAVRP